MDADIWDALRSTSPGQLANVGYPVRSASPAFIAADSRMVTLDGGQWGPGQLVRRNDGSWRWHPQLNFGFQTQEQDRWTSTDDRMDLRLRCAATLAERRTHYRHRWPQASSFRTGRRPLPGVARALAERLGLPFGTPAWEPTPADEGYNDQRFASYRLRVAGEAGRTALGLWARFQLPDGLQPTIVGLVDLRIDFAALPAPAQPPPIPAGTRLGVDDLRHFFVAARTTANHDLPLAVTIDPQEQKPAGPAVTELHLQAEHAYAPIDDRIQRLPDLLDLSALGEPTRESLPRMSIAVTAPPAASAPVNDLVNDALRRMAVGFGFLEFEDDTDPL